METQTRFDLNAAIARWLHELAGQPNLTAVVRKELEMHLRDTITELRAKGLNSEESFWLARRRVGAPQQLGEEFTKVDPGHAWRERGFWVLLGLLVVGLWSSTFNSLGIATFLGDTRNIGKGTLALGVALFLMRWLPVVLGAFLLARERFRVLGNMERVVLGSGKRLVGIVMVWIVANAGLSLWLLHRQLPFNTLHELTPWIIELCRALLWPGLLLGLSVWLMPKRPALIHDRPDALCR